MARLAQITQNNKFEKYFYYLKEEMRDEVFFFVQMNIIVIYKLMLLFFMGVGEDAKSTQNNKYVVSVQISRKN